MEKLNFVIELDCVENTNALKHYFIHAYPEFKSEIELINFKREFHNSKKYFGFIENKFNAYLMSDLKIDTIVLSASDLKNSVKEKNQEYTGIQYDYLIEVKCLRNHDEELNYLKRMGYNGWNLCQVRGDTFLSTDKYYWKRIK